MFLDQNQLSFMSSGIQQTTTKLLAQQTKGITMSIFIKSGNTFSVHPDDQIDSRPVLPVGTYTVMFHPERGYYLETTPDLEIGFKVYGDSEELSDRILNTYHERKSNTGVLLSGEKGSGKTLLAKMVSIKGLAKGIITIYVNQPFTGEGFNKFISTINQPCIIMIDEFEKLYKDSEQERLLTLFDGLYTSKKMFMITINQTNRISDFLVNRPGRFFYHLRYTGLKDAEIIEYCKDKLNNVSLTDSIVRACKSFKAASYDILSSIIEELNRYNEPLERVLTLLNIELNQSARTYSVKSLVNKKTGNQVIVQKSSMRPRLYYITTQPVDVYFYESAEDEKADSGQCDADWMSFNPTDIVNMSEDIVTYSNEDYVLTIQEASEQDLKAMMLKNIAARKTPIPTRAQVPATDPLAFLSSMKKTA